MAKVLVIDDDAAAETMFLGDSLDSGGSSDSGDNAGGNEFVFAASDDAAIAVLSERDDLDIAIVAVDSDAVSGMDLFLKLDPKDARLPRIALSSRPDMDLLRDALKRGASDFLVKPIAPDDLAETLDRVYRVCERRRANWMNETELSAIRREIEIAGEIQRRILPRTFPAVDGLDIFARTVPAKAMGGDFYDVFTLPDGNLALVIADVSGKGVPAAFFMAVARTLIRATVFHEASPAACLERVNQILCRHDVPGMFVSVFFGVLDRQRWVLSFANGGHPLPLLVRPGEDGEAAAIEALEGGRGTLLGIDEAQTYAQEEVSLAPGVGVFLYTDGLTEAFSADHKPFGEDRLEAALSVGGAGTSGDMAKGVAAAVADFVGAAAQHDDITSMVIKRLG